MSAFEPPILEKVVIPYWLGVITHGASRTSGSDHRYLGLFACYLLFWLSIW